MQPTRDKDFDGFFKNTFDDAEIVPTKDLWNGIEHAIEPKRKRIIPVHWLVAAIVLIIATVGVLVYEQGNNKPNQLAKIVATKATEIDLINPTKNETVAPVVVPVEIVEQRIRNTVKPKVNQSDISVLGKSVTEQKLITGHEVQKPEVFIANIEQSQKEITVKVEDVVIKPKEETILVANVTLGDGNEENGSAQPENKGIRNVGDVVNLIVNKLDKRKDKFIQFRTDDDESSLSAINIGPFKIGKRK